MKLLAVDTANGICSVALYADRQVMASKTEHEVSRQAEMLVPMMESLLEEQQLTYEGLDGLATSIGPGSFTGVRIGMAAIKGVACVMGLPVTGVTTLEAVVWQASQEYGERSVLAVLDARRQQYYIQLFEGLQATGEAMLVDTSLLANQVKEGVLVASNCPELISEQLPDVELTPAIQPHAIQIASCAALKIEQGEQGNNVTPLYIRPPDAKKPKPVMPL